MALFTIEMVRFGATGGRPKLIDRITHAADNPESARAYAKEMVGKIAWPEDANGVRVLDNDGREILLWRHGEDDA